MNNSCELMQGVLIDQILGPLPEEDARLLAEHVDNCSECGRFREQLISQDQILGEWGRNMQDQMTQKAQEAAAAFLARPNVHPQTSNRTWLYYAAAAVLIAAALFGLLWPLRPRPDLSEKEVVGPGVQKQMEVGHPQGAAPALTGQTEMDKRTQAELQIAQVLFDEGDVTALAALYKAGTDPTRQAVLNYLAKIGTEEALRTLSDLEKFDLLQVDPNSRSQADPADRGKKDRAEAAAPKAEPAARIERQDYFDPNAVDADNWQSGVLGIRVLDDETGKPIGGADLKFWSFQKMDLPKAAATNQYGRYELKYYIPEVRYLRVAVSQAPYAGKYLSWNPPESGLGIPLQYEVRLKKGTTVGGLVETADGRPLEGVEVDMMFSLSDESAVESALIDDTGLVTDENGRWELGCFPGDLKEDVFISVDHPEYVSVQRYSIQAELETLRNKNCVIQMQKGLTVRGQVTDLEGRPIEGAAIYTGTSRYVSEKRQIQTDAGGVYTISNCKAHDLVLTVMAAGYAPDMREILVRQTLGDVNFQLEPGYSVTVRVVDRNENGIEGVKIEGNKWRTYGDAEQEAQTIRRSAQTDALGYATLTDLPADEVTYTIRKSEYAGYNNYPMVAGEQDHYTVVLLPEGKLTGRVLDSQTGLAVQTFTLIEGIQWRNQKEPTWQSHRGKLCVNGVYEQKLYYQDLGLAVRIEAEGYLPAESHTYINNGTQIAEDLFLYQGQGPGGIVYLPDGQPAAMAEVYVQNEDHYLQIENGRIRGDGMISDQTDEQGQFRLPAVEFPYCLVALHETGGAIVSSEEFEQTGTLSLQAWSRVEGTVYLNNKPATNQTLALRPAFSEDDCGDFSVTSKATTDENGRFSCGRLFPGRIQVSRIIPLDNRSDQHVNTRFVRVEPGQTASVEIGKGGRTVTGKLLLPAEMRGDSYDHVNLHIQASISRELPDSPEILIPENYFVMTRQEKEQFQQELMQTQAWKEYMQKKTESQGQVESAFHESVMIESDGTVRAESIPPGDYWLTGSIGDPKVQRHSNEWYNSQMGTVKFSFTVPDAADETDYEKPLDLGMIPIDPIKILRVGQGVPAVDLEGLDGNPVRLSDYRGSYVLLDFGFVMVSENPGEFAGILKTLYAEFHSPRRFEILSVLPASGSFSKSMNDSYRKAILYFVKKQEIPWSVGMLSEADVWQELASSGISPSLLLVDPEGNVAALNIKPEELKETLNRYLSPDQDEPETP